MREITDPVERVVAEALDAAGVPYRLGGKGELDFECDGFAIECKRMFSPRIMRQIEGRENVIVIQGLGAAEAFAGLVARCSREGSDDRPLQCEVIETDEAKNAGLEYVPYEKAFRIRFYRE